MEGIKDKNGKLSYCDIPVQSLKSLAKVFQDSKKSGKYSRNNHIKPIKNTDLIDAIQRHLLEIMDGNDLDESGNTHYSHIIANAVILENQYQKGILIENRLNNLKNE